MGSNSVMRIDTVIDYYVWCIAPRGAARRHIVTLRAYYRMNKINSTVILWYSMALLRAVPRREAWWLKRYSLLLYLSSRRKVIRCDPDSQMAAKKRGTAVTPMAASGSLMVHHYMSYYDVHRRHIFCRQIFWHYVISRHFTTGEQYVRRDGDATATRRDGTRRITVSEIVYATHHGTREIV